MDPQGWMPIETAPEGEWVVTAKAGERGANLCCRTGDEWHDQAGRSTVTHHSFAAPTHWMPLPPPPTKEP